MRTCAERLPHLSLSMKRSAQPIRPPFTSRERRPSEAIRLALSYQRSTLIVTPRRILVCYFRQMRQRKHRAILSCRRRSLLF